MQLTKMTVKLRRVFQCVVIVTLLAPAICQNQPDLRDGLLRLVGDEPGAHEGLLQVYYNGTWGTICSRRFNVFAARLSCRSLGYGMNVGQKLYGRYRTTYDPIWLNEVACYGNETQLIDCGHNPWGQIGSCVHMEDVFISCLNDVRLADGDTHTGRLEVYHNGVWGTVCNRLFDDLSATVACRSLGYRYGRMLIGNNRTVRGSGTIWLNDVVCNGHEPSIDICRHSSWGNNYCTHESDVSISCDNTTDSPVAESAVRLAGSQLSNEGRLEVYHNGSWGTVCDDGFTETSAKVACRILGFGNNVGEFISNYYGPGVGPIWLRFVNCQGSETSIADCPRAGWGTRACYHGEDVSISCRDPLPGNKTLRLVGGNNVEGRLEIYHNRTWGTVCDDSFDDADARVACKNLGFGYVGRTLGNRYGAGRGQIWLDDVECVGYETDLSFCRHNGWGVHNCGHFEDVSISCNDSTVVVYNGTRVRLAGSHLRTEGRLEVYHDGVWGTVCDDGFSANDARVACRSLGFADAGWSLDNRYGPGVGRIWLDDVSCDGSESFIGNCRHQGWGHNNCMHSEDVSIACNEATDGGVRLIGSQFEGRLEVFHEGVWGTVCNDAFDDTDAKVVCKSLGYGNVGRTLHKQFGEGTGRIWLDGVQCTGSEVSIVDCKHKDWGVHDCFHYEDVSISCISTDLKSSGVNGASIAVPIVVGVIIIAAIGIIIVRRRRRAALSESQSGILGFNEPTLEVADDDVLLNA